MEVKGEVEGVRGRVKGKWKEEEGEQKEFLQLFMKRREQGWEEGRDGIWEGVDRWDGKKEMEGRGNERQYKGMEGG